MQLEENIKGICLKFGMDYSDFLRGFGVKHPTELSINDLNAISQKYQLDLCSLLFNSLYKTQFFSDKLEKIKLLVLDVDGVLTDGGMYFTKNGDQIKKYNTKDGMALLYLRSIGFNVAIISSGFNSKMVKERAKMLKIQHCFVSRERKLDVLMKLLKKLDLTLDQVAMIGDDVNDREVMQSVGVSACPYDAVEEVKRISNVVLNKSGGDGCVREFIDNYLLSKPIK